MPFERDGVSAFPFAALFPPAFPEKNGGFPRSRSAKQRFKKVFGVGVDGHIHVESGFLHLRRIDIHHDDLGFPRPCFPIVAYLTDADARPYGKDKVAVLYGEIARAVAHVSAAAAVERIVVLHKIDAVPIGDDGYAQPFRRKAKFFVPAGKAYAAARIDHGAFCLCDFFEYFIRRLVADVRGQKRGVLFGCIPAQAVRFNRHSLIIDGNVQPDGSGAARLHEKPGFFQHITDVLGLFQHFRVFTHTAHRAGDIEFLIADRAQGQSVGKTLRIAGGGVVTHLSADDEHGNGIQPRAEHARDRVGAAGPVVTQTKAGRLSSLA